MKIAQKSAHPAIADDYLALLRRFPLREITSDKQLEAAHTVLQPLLLRDERSLSRGESDYVGALAVLVHDYEKRRYASNLSNLSPSDRLKHLLDESKTTPAALEKILGVSQPLVSMILNGKRELSKDNIGKLAGHFGIDAGYLL